MIRTSRILSSFQMGKLPPAMLKSNVLRYLGCSSDSVVVGPAVGEDSAVIRVGGGDGVLISAKSDPITGASSNIGRLVVHVNANDIAASGGEPKWMLLTQLLPLGTTPELVEEISRQVHETCLELGVSLVGGHTEVTPAVTQPLLCGTMLGTLLSRVPIRTGGARPGDRILLTKGAAIEGTSILCADRIDRLVRQSVFRDREEALQCSSRHASLLSVVPDARTLLHAVPEGAVSSMHDPTEGGVAGAIHEVADASGKGFRMIRSQVPMSDETRRVAQCFGVDPMELIGSGALLVCVAPQHSDIALQALQEKGIVVADVGEIVEDPTVRTIVESKGETKLRRPEQDALWEALKLE